MGEPVASESASAAPGKELAQIVARSALWLALSCWIGSWALFALVVAPTAFRILPSTEIAGTLVGPVLETLHLYGAAAAAVLAGLAWTLRRGPLLRLLPLALCVACLYSQFGVSAEIAEIRDLAFGPEGDEGAAARFTELHTQSRFIFTGVWLGTLVLLVLHTREDVRTVT